MRGSSNKNSDDPLFVSSAFNCDQSFYKEPTLFQPQGYQTADTVENIKKSVVYILDDDQDDRLFGYSVLRKSDHVTDVRPVNSADTLFQCFDDTGLYQSITFAEYHTPVILLDVHMPKVNGIEALEKIRNHPITSDFPVILLTTDHSCEKVYDAYRLQANGYLQKPFDLSQFHDVMDRVNSGLMNMKFGGE